MIGVSDLIAPGSKAVARTGPAWQSTDCMAAWFSALIFLNVQQCSAVNTKLESSPDALDDPREVVNFGGAAPENSLDDEFGAHVGEFLRCKPREVRISTPHMLEVEGAIADAIGLEQCRPFFALATTIVANGDLGPQQYYRVTTVSARRAAV